MNMQLLDIVLFSHHDQCRVLRLQPGAVNVITRSSNSRVWRGAEVALAARGYGKTWRGASDLFRALSAQRILDVNLVCQGQARKCTCTYSQAIEGSF